MTTTITMDEIMEQVGQAIQDDGKFYGMTYEQGVLAALEWVIGVKKTPPMSE